MFLMRTFHLIKKSITKKKKRQKHAEANFWYICITRYKCYYLNSFYYTRQGTKSLTKHTCCTQIYPLLPKIIKTLKILLCNKNTLY